MPTLSEKNACPMALMTTSLVTLEKSGVSRNLMPSMALGMVSENAARTKMMSRSRGIMILL